MAGEIPSLDPARHKDQVNGYIYASNGKTILAVLRGDESRVLVDAKDISPAMKLAIVAIEDRRFYEHRGVDVRGIARALWADIRSKSVVEGGSTITQQFVKNAYVKNQRSIARKLREAALAWQLEQHWKKDRILTAYLNTIYFGNGAYGVQQAARVYFDTSAKDLTLPEAALLAGIPADPSAYDPVAHPEASARRRALVLRAMLDQRDVSDVEYRKAVAAPMPKPEDVHLPGTLGQAPYFANYVKEQLIARYGARKVYGGGLRVKTTIDLGLQTLAREAVAKWLPPDGEGPTAALVAIDPRTGAVLAMVGGENYHKSQFNLAVQGRRQPGSSFKPFVLATALKQGIAPSTTFVSRPVEIPLGDRVWVVHNYEDDYLGPISLDSATTHSDNSVYAQLTRIVQPRNVAATARSLGIQSPLPSYFAIGLGAEAVNPLEMARGFSAFANGGYRIDGEELGNRPRVIDSIQDPDRGRVSNAALPHRVLDTNQAAIVNLLLQHVVQEGTGHRAALPDRAVAGKTGTTENYGDAWFVGYTPQLVAAVWVGYPDKLVPMLTEYHGQPVAGGTYPALIWKSFMESAVRELSLPPESFDPPQVISGSARRAVIRDGRLELDNGYCRGTFELVFLPSGGPSRTAGCLRNEVEVPLVVGRTLSAAKARLAGQPLTPAYVYKPARPGQRLGIVLGQFPRTGVLSSYDKVTLVLAKSLHGVVPKVVGLPLARARAKLRRLKVEVVVRGDATGRVVGQRPAAGVAAAPGMRVTLSVRAGSGTASRRGSTARAARPHG